MIVEHAQAEENDVHALRALRAGTASPDQQRKALDWIINKACIAPMLPFYDTFHETAFGLGRQFVAKEIGRLLTLRDLSSLRRQDDDVPAKPARARAGR